MNEIIKRTEVGEELKKLDGCYLDHKETHSETYIDADLYRYTLGEIPPRRMASKTIYLVIYDQKRFAASSGPKLISKLYELGFNVQHDVTSSKRFGLNPNTGVGVMYHHRVIIEMTRPI